MCADRTQGKKENYNPTHELERVLLDEDSPHARKRNPKRDLASLSPDMRLLETECVHYLPPVPPLTYLQTGLRFTAYDFKSMQRRSYYPTNPHTVTSVTVTSSSGAGISSSPVTPAADASEDSSSFLPQIGSADESNPGHRDTESFDETLDIRGHQAGKRRA